MKEGLQYYAFFPTQGEPIAWNFLYPHLIAAQRMSCLPRTVWGGASIAHTVAAHIRDCGFSSGRIGLIGVHHNRGVTLPIDHYLIWEDELPHVTFSNLTKDAERLTLVKSPEELAFYQHGARYTDYTVSELIKATKPGVSDVMLVGQTAVAAYEVGGEVDQVLLGSTSMIEPDMSYPWYSPTERVIRQGDVVLSEVSVNYGGCSGQLLVPVSVGDPTPEYRELYDIARRTFTNVQRVLRPGATQDDVLEAARPIVDAGLVTQAPIIHGWPDPPFYPVVPVDPSLNAYNSERFVLKENMLVVVEPNPTTRDLKRGMCLGALHLVTQDGGRNLHEHPLDFVVV